MIPRSPALYFDDITVGLRFTTGSHRVDEAQIIDFARRFDPQPFHTDPEAAAGSVFAGLAASGWHTAAITMRLLVEDGAPLAGGIVGAGTEITWPRPTRPGDVLRVDVAVPSSFPNGRPLSGEAVASGKEEDVTDVALSLVLTGLSSPVTDYVNGPGDGRRLLPTFPYLATPFAGDSEGKGKPAAL